MATKKLPQMRLELFLSEDNAKLLKRVIKAGDTTLGHALRPEEKVTVKFMLDSIVRQAALVGFDIADRGRWPK